MEIRATFWQCEHYGLSDPHQRTSLASTLKRLSVSDSTISDLMKIMMESRQADPNTRPDAALIHELCKLDLGDYYIQSFDIGFCIVKDFEFEGPVDEIFGEVTIFEALGS